MEKLLIIDDNADLRKMLSTAFSYGKYTIFEAENGWQGVITALQERPGIVMLDIMMPDMSGFEVCRRIRSHEELKGCYIIMLSALSQEKDIQAGMEAGADYYMTKPFSPSKLIAVVEGLRTGKRTHEDIDALKLGISLRMHDNMIPDDLRTDQPASQSSPASGKADS